MNPVVVLPVFNAVEAVDACLASLINTLGRDDRVLIADDASTDRSISVLLQAFERRATFAVTIVRRTHNLGFVGNVNAAFGECSGDVVLLNSDTLTTSGWLDRLTACAASDPRIATATPWSNNAEICSFPRFCEANPGPEDADFVASAALHSGPPEYPELPTAVGFCMYMRRRALQMLGTFDQATFGRGYGEENDWCLRASGHGWRHVLCDDAYVVHSGGASFAAEGHRPGGENLSRLLARYPGYNELIADFILRDPLRGLRQRLQEAMQQRQQPAPQRDLFS